MYSVKLVFVFLFPTHLSKWNSFISPSSINLLYYLTPEYVKIVLNTHKKSVYLEFTFL